MHIQYHNLLFLLDFSHCVLAASHPPEQRLLTPPSIKTSTSIHDALKYSSIISDVLDDFEPAYSLSATYPESHESVHLGNDIPVSSVSSRPIFELSAMPVQGLTPASTNKTFTLILTDPDAKSRDNPKWSEMCHWIMTNLTAPVTLDIIVSKKGELMEYLPPAPPPKTGKHRYVFVLLEGRQGQDLSPPKDRKHWGYEKPRHGVRDWAKENALKVVGANFFYAQNEKQ